MIEGTEVKILLDDTELIISPKDGPKRKIIGILGGMGPEATADLYMKIIKFSQKKYGAKYDCDYPQIIINSIPAPQMIDGLDGKKREELLKVLKEGVKKLELCGVDFIVTACNTVCYFLPELRKTVSVPILSIIEETVKKGKEKKIKKVGLLATTTTVNERIYERKLAEFGIKTILPGRDSQYKTTEIIRKIIAGKKSKTDRTTLKSICEELKRKGADGVILGCTDLPLIIRKNNFGTEIIDSTEVLAESSADISYGNKLFQKE